MQRLSEILGALHYLRDVCGAKEGQTWRNEMQALVDAEAPSGERRERLIASFNRGYRGFQQTYRTCTPAADFAIRRYLEEGSQDRARHHGALRELIIARATRPRSTSSRLPVRSTRSASSPSSGSIVPSTATALLSSA